MRFVLLTILPIVAAAAVPILGTLAAMRPSEGTGLRTASVLTAITLAVLLVVKAILDHRREQSVKQTRFDTLRELHRRLAPALDRITELALSESTGSGAAALRAAVLRDIAGQCSAALIGMIGDEPKGARAGVFRLTAAPEQIEPIGWGGRADQPRTFDASEEGGAEVLAYLRGARLEAELYTDIRKKAPHGYRGDTGRYRTFIRVPLWSSTGVVFGMLTLDAPRARSLTRDHQALAELIAAELEPAFAAASL